MRAPMALFATLALCAATSSCARGAGASGATDAAVELLVLDADGGATNADGERLGVLHRARPDGAGGAALEPLATDARWLEPVDALARADGSILVLEALWAPDASREARGALFELRDGRVSLLWSDERLRQPVALAAAADGTLYVSDRAADPLGLRRSTGAVFALRRAADGGWRAEIAAAGEQLVTPGALLVTRDGRLFVMDADANPTGALDARGRPATPGVLYEVLEGGLVARLAPTITTSPIALLEQADGTLLLVDANFGTTDGCLGDGALLALDLRTGSIDVRIDPCAAGRARALVDPASAAWLPDGRIAVADANADPLGRGADGTSKGVHGTGPGALLALDPARGTVEVLLADARFATPLCVRRAAP